MNFRPASALPTFIVAFLLATSAILAQKSSSIEGQRPRGGGPAAASPSASPSASAKPAAPGLVDEKLFKGMQWRQIGPFRGGRALSSRRMINLAPHRPVGLAQ